MTVTMQHLLDWLARYGWQAQTASEEAITLTFVGDDPEIGFPVFMLLEEDWLRINIPLLIPAVPPAALLALRLNDQSRLARLAVDNDEMIAATVDLDVAAELTYETFELALDAVTYLAETASPRLAAVASGLPDPVLPHLQAPAGPFTLHPKAAAWSGLPDSEAFPLAQAAERIVRDPANFSGTDTFGNAWFVDNAADGTQIWVQTRHNEIRAYGVNRQRRPFPRRDDA
ncbi:MAG: YbjN domain-containing protein [Chloroflexi bacterium]|nr:YbjN domain-containing protein [Chloroflexota bacterium]